MDNRDRASPVALPRHTPVAQPVGCLTRSRIGGFKRRNSCTLAILYTHPVPWTGIEKRPGPCVGGIGNLEVAGISIARQDNGDHAKTVGVGKIQVALVMGRTAEDGAGAIFHKHEIGDVNGKPAVRDKRMLHGQAGIETFLFSGFHSGFRRAQLGAFCKKVGGLRIVPCNSDGEGVVRGHRDERRAVKRIRPRCEDFDTVCFSGDILWNLAGNGETDTRALGPADPVLLHQPDAVWPAIEPLDGIKKIICIFGDLQEPLRQEPAFDRSTGAPAASVHHLFIGKDRSPMGPS